MTDDDIKQEYLDMLALYETQTLRDLLQAVREKDYAKAVQVKLTREALRDALNSNYFYVPRFMQRGTDLVL